MKKICSTTQGLHLHHYSLAGINNCLVRSCFAVIMPFSRLGDQPDITTRDLLIVKQSFFIWSGGCIVTAHILIHVKVLGKHLLRGYITHGVSRKLGTMTRANESLNWKLVLWTQLNCSPGAAYFPDEMFGLRTNQKLYVQQDGKKLNVRK